MICVKVYKTSDETVRKFELLGHAQFAEPGEDVVCAAVSALVLNTINSIESFTDERYVTECDEETGHILYEFREKPGPEAVLLVRSMLLGLQMIEESYGNDYINILSEEVQES